MRGFAFALNDIGLAVFTTLAPGATCAYIVLVLVIVRGHLDAPARRKVERLLAIPLAMVILGLVASATHLGTPANALYVFRRVGQSPLATEVTCAVTFLGIACLHWFVTFFTDRHLRARDAWLVISAVAGVVFLWGTTRAYALPTVPSWDSPYSMANLPLTGIAACAPIAVPLLHRADLAGRTGLVRALTCMSLLAMVAGVTSMTLQYADLGTIRSVWGTARSLVPAYPVSIAAWAVAITLDAVMVGRGLRGGRTPAGALGPDAGAGPGTVHPQGTIGDKTGGGANADAAPHVTGITRWEALTLYAPCALVLTATFFLRFQFYMFHTTLGVA